MPVSSHDNPSCCKGPLSLLTRCQIEARLCAGSLVVQASWTDAQSERLSAAAAVDSRHPRQWSAVLILGEDIEPELTMSACSLTRHASSYFHCEAQ